MLGLVPFKFNNGENSKGLSINDMFNDFFNDDMLADVNVNIFLYKKWKIIMYNN